MPAVIELDAIREADPPEDGTPRALEIDGRRIDDRSDCYVIAEVGHNHQGRLDRAKEMLRVARECGADAVKLQKRDNQRLYTRAMYEAPYENENSFGPTYGAHREALELDRDAYQELARYARELGITLFATVWDFASADFMADLGAPAYKIASGDLKTTPLIEHVARLGKPLIVSTGGGTIEDVERVYELVMPINPRLCLLQCTASYPSEPEEMNLRVIHTYRERFPDVVVGLSDHQSGIAMAEIAYILGARVIEKHFTLNRAWKGTDHAFSLEPSGLRKLVRDLRRARVALGDGIKQPQAGEREALRKMGKMLVAARALEAGHTLAAADVLMKSPAAGLFPHELPNVLGRRLRRALAADEPLRKEDLADA